MAARIAHDPHRRATAGGPGRPDVVTIPRAPGRAGTVAIEIFFLRIIEIVSMNDQRILVNSSE
jgi:hypothetical protein